MKKPRQHGGVIRKILDNSTAFKRFWETVGPFRYALTSKEFPPVLLAAEEWIFSDDLTLLLKDLMQFDLRKMAVVKSDFNPGSKTLINPDGLIPWRINNFCEEWESMPCDLFTPMGHLTDRVCAPDADCDAASVEALFFSAIESRLDAMGYMLLKPLKPAYKYASVHAYLREWAQDDADAGLT